MSFGVERKLAKRLVSFQEPVRAAPVYGDRLPSRAFPGDRGRSL